MPLYPPEINAIAGVPANAGKPTGTNAVGTAASFECGSFVRFYLRIDRQALTISEIRFVTNGCGYAVAAADRIAGLLTGKPLTELHGLTDGELAAGVSHGLGEFPAGRMQCREICFDALRAALVDFRALQIEEFAGENALVCTCFGVTEETLLSVIDENAIDTVAGVTAKTNAGGGCGSCRMLIQEIIDSRVHGG